MVPCLQCLLTHTCVHTCVQAPAEIWPWDSLSLAMHSPAVLMTPLPRFQTPTPQFLLPHQICLPQLSALLHLLERLGKKTAKHESVPAHPASDKAPTFSGWLGNSWLLAVVLIFNNNTFHSQIYPSLDNKFYNHFMLQARKKTTVNLVTQVRDIDIDLVT